MQIGVISGATRTIGRSQGYLGLPLRDVTLHDAVNGPGTPAMETAWFPTPREIEAINAGAPIILRILGDQHPPVMLTTGDTPRDADTMSADDRNKDLIVHIAHVLAPGLYDMHDNDAFARAFTSTAEAAGLRLKVEALARTLIDRIRDHG